MSSDIAYIGLGSNLAQPYQQIKQAIFALDNLPNTNVSADSGYYISKPMGPDDQPDYVNAVVEIKTQMSAIELLEHCQSIEKKQGRLKTRHWGERSIDLDILTFGQQMIETDRLVVPHPGISKRDFVYMPLLRICPDIEVPGLGLLDALVNSVTKNNSDFSCVFAGDIDR